MKKPKRMIERQYHLTHGEVLRELKKMQSDIYDGAFCDPPYGLGFMGKKWDQNVPGVDVWRDVFRVCKPGAYLLTFGSPKTFHRLVCNLEDAGWEIRDTICWLHGEGKSPSSDFSQRIRRFSGHAKTAQKFRGRGTSLRPLWEPVVLAMKPVHEAYHTNAVVFGCAGLNVQNCRTEGKRGRLPSNVVLDEESAHMLDERSSTTRSHRGFRRPANRIIGNGRTMNTFVSRCSTVEGYDDEGGASRFFYVAKANGKERYRNEHPAVKPLQLCEHLARLILPPKLESQRCLLVPFSGSGSEMTGALNAGWDHVRGIEKDERYIEIAQERLRNRSSLTVVTTQQQPTPVDTSPKFNSVTKGNCVEVISQLPNKSVNLALCSPPYPGKRGDKYPTVSEIDYPAWTARWMETLRPKLAGDGSILIVIDKHVTKGVMSDFLLRTQLCLRERGWKQHMTHIWFKHDGLPLGHKWWPHHSYEEILWFSQTTHPFCDPWAAGSPSTNLAVRNYDQSEWTNGEKSKKEGIARMRDVLVVPVGGNAKGVDHPAKYPQALCEALIKTFCPEDGTVLDCFAGSGTTLLAAKATGRNFYGIDIVKKFVDLARRRLKEDGSQSA